MTNSQNNLILFSLLLLLTASIIAAYKKFQVPGIAGFKRTDFLALPKIAGYEAGSIQSSFRTDPHRLAEAGRKSKALTGFTLDLDDPEQKLVRKPVEHFFAVEPEVKPAKREKPAESSEEKEELFQPAEEQETAPAITPAGEKTKASSGAGPEQKISRPDTEQGKININKAGPEELMKIPFVGKVTADNIIMFRKDLGGYKRIEDIKKVPKMERYFDRIKDFITVN